jgi:hypothetical protein
VLKKKLDQDKISIWETSWKQYQEETLNVVVSLEGLRNPMVKEEKR